MAPNSGCQIWGQISGRVPLSAVKKLQSKSLYVFNLPVMVLILKTIKFIHQVFTWKWLEIRHFKICKEIVLKYRSLTQIRQNKQSPEVGKNFHVICQKKSFQTIPNFPKAILKSITQQFIVRIKQSERDKSAKVALQILCQNCCVYVKFW